MKMKYKCSGIFGEYRKMSATITSVKNNYQYGGVGNLNNVSAK
jgi:hypothetical protein